VNSLGPDDLVLHLTGGEAGDDIRPGAREVYRDAGTDLQVHPVDPVANAGALHTAAVNDEPSDLGIVGHRRPTLRCTPDKGKTEALGARHLTVVIEPRAGQPIPDHTGFHPDHFIDGEHPVSRNPLLLIDQVPPVKGEEVV